MEGKKTLRQKALEEIDKVRWIPESGYRRIRSMVENRPDWCISRQRVWGVPITVFYCKRCGEVLADAEIFERIARLVESYEYGADIWFEKEAKELLPEGYRCPKCGSTEFEKEEDILDVWFDSGSSHAAVLKRRGIPKADMYLEGSDQHRGWFQSSLLEGVASYDEAPYRSVLTHGFILDEKGRKMSKSLGNVVSPQEVVERYGADILRLWTVSEDYTEDVKIGEQVLKAVAEDYRKIRNTIRFLLGNLYDFNPDRDALKPEDLLEFDRWMLSHLQVVLKEVHRFFSQYQFYRAFSALKAFVNRELSAVYLDVLKDRLYVYAPDSRERRSAQTVLWELLLALTTVLAPVLSFTAEEVWQTVRRSIKSDLPESVFLASMYLPKEELIDEKLEEVYSKLLKLREEVNRALEQARRQKLVRHPYEAKVVLGLPPGLKDLVEERLDYLPFFLSVSRVELSAEPKGAVELEGEEVKGLKVAVSPAEGQKCPRCWLYFPEEEFEELPDGQKVCRRCYGALRAAGVV
ncbi:MAG: class I tRNA ligase family protein [Aquificae bacterium]|nr:class I tRNA ligase family protein [Aquificota bacterium]